MPQMPKGFVPDQPNALPKGFVADPVGPKKKGLFEGIADDLAAFLESHPKLREGLQRGLTGSSPEFEKLKTDKGITKTLGTPESEGSVLPEIGQPETFAGGFAKSIYDDFIRPLGTPSGALGSSMPIREPSIPMRAPEVPPQRLLGPGSINLPEGVTRDVPDALPLRRSREIPYQSPESYSTAELGRPTAKLYDPEAEYQAFLSKMAKEDVENAARIRGTPEDIPDNPAARRLEALRTTGREPMPIRQSNTSVQDIIKPESLNTMDRMHAEANPIFRQMQETGMFNRTPEALPIRNQAMFKYMQPDELGNQFPMFDVQGNPGPMNPSGGSDLSLQSLGERGIDLAEGPLPANRTPPVRRSLSPFGEAEGTKALTGEILGPEKTLAERIESGEKIPDYNQLADNGAVLVHNLHGKGFDGYADERTLSFIKDTERMKSERLRTESNPEYIKKQKIKNDKWNKMQEAISSSNDFFGVKEKTNTRPEKLGQRLLGEEGSAKIIEDKKPLPPSKGPAGPAVDKLLNNIQQSKGIRTKQEGIYKQERARRFAAFEGVSEGGISGAKQSLGKLRGEYDKINRSPLGMSPEETDSLFNAVKGSYLTTPEKARAYSTLFKILEGGGVPQRNELKLLDDVFSDGFAEKFIEMHGGLGATGIKIGKTANTMKSMMSSLDLSAPLRQGIGLIHRPEWRDSFKEMFNYLTNKDYFDNAMLALHERPTYQMGRESGLFLAKPDNLLSGEEAFMNSYVHNLPGIKNIVGASERAYTGFLNKLRADTFDNLMQNAKDMGHNPEDISRNIAKYINVSTGRGSLGALEKIAPELNSILWSPRLISSRLSILNPKYYIDADSFTRKEALKSLFAIAAAGTTVAGLAKAMGADVSLNPTSSDFGKIRFGNKVLDPWAGFQQPIVAASRMISEANRMREGKKKKFGDPTIPEIAGRFMVNKLAPATGLAYDVATARAFTGGGGFTDRFGNKKTIQAETLKRFVPIFAQDVQQLIKDDPSFAESIGLGGAALFGAGVQDYPERTPNAPIRRKMGLSF